MSEDCTVVRFSREPSSARIENLKQTDGGYPEKNYTDFGGFYVTCVLFSVITYIADLVLVCVLLYFYSIDGHGVYFALTLSFLIVPALLMTAFNFRWYIVDNDDPSISRTTLCTWIIRVVFLLLQVSPLLRYLDTLIYGIKSVVAPDNVKGLYYRRMLDEDTNGALLRLFHCFLHSAPQAVLQLVILLNHVDSDKLTGLRTDVAVIQAWTVLVGLISIAWSVTSYHRSVRYSREDKRKMTWSGTVVCFCWQLTSVVSRVLALSLLAALYPTWLGVVIGLHWGMMSVWLALGQQQTTACSNRCEEMLLSASLGLAYVVAFISPRDGPTRYIYLAYYLVCVMENTAALVVWCVVNNSTDNPLLYYGAPTVQVASFLLAIVFLFIYYKYCHPAQSHSKIPPLSESSTLDFDKPSYSKSCTHRSHS